LTREELAIASERVDLALIEAIRRGWEDEWTSPTCAQLAAQLGCSRSTAHKRLRRLVLRGDLECKRASEKRILYRATSS
jgi:DNA-binding IclR family transcriptional regulator